MMALLTSALFQLEIEPVDHVVNASLQDKRLETPAMVEDEA
jgi:hypothetical protein